MLLSLVSWRQFTVLKHLAPPTGLHGVDPNILTYLLNYLLLTYLLTDPVKQSPS